MADGTDPFDNDRCSYTTIVLRGGYYRTLRLYQIAKLIADHDPVALRADPILRALRDKIDESILLAKVQRISATYLLAI